MKKSIVTSLLSLGMCGLMNVQNASASDVNVCVQDCIFNPNYYTVVVPVGRVYYIYDAYQLNWISYLVQQGYTFEGYRIEIMRDLDFYGIGFLPIGNHDRPFEGVLDGRGHTIRNLELNYIKNIEIGLVGCLGAKGLVQNINLSSSCKFEACALLGGIVGCNFGLVRHCNSRANLTAIEGKVGGIVGLNQTKGRVEDCRVWILSSISAEHGKWGYFIGLNHGESPVECATYWFWPW